MVQSQEQEPSRADLVEAIRREGSGRKAAAALGMAEATFRRKLKASQLGGGALETTDLPDDDISIEDLLAMRKKVFAAKSAYKEATKLINVKVKMRGPIGLLHFGDPHVDDDGTDIQALERDTELCQKTEGLFGCNIGDTTNNWVGRLARLYGDQSTTAKQAWMLAEWFLKRVYWLYVIRGNHDAWSGAGDPIDYIVRGGSTLPPSLQARIGLQFPNGREVRVNARHDFAGNSQWNPAHGQMKAAQMGMRDHINISGHKHKSGYGVVKDPLTGVISHCIQVASYKVHDRFAEERGFRDEHISPCALTIIDPDAKHEAELVHMFWDAEHGADYLNFLRGKFK